MTVGPIAVDVTYTFKNLKQNALKSVLESEAKKIEDEFPRYIKTWKSETLVLPEIQNEILNSPEYVSGVKQLYLSMRGIWVKNTGDSVSKDTAYYSAQQAGMTLSENLVTVYRSIPISEGGNPTDKYVNLWNTCSAQYVQQQIPVFTAKKGWEYDAKTKQYCV